MVEWVALCKKIPIWGTHSGCFFSAGGYQDHYAAHGYGNAGIGGPAHGFLFFFIQFNGAQIGHLFFVGKPYFPEDDHDDTQYNEDDAQDFHNY